MHEHNFVVNKYQTQVLSSQSQVCSAERRAAPIQCPRPETSSQRKEDPLWYLRPCVCRTELISGTSKSVLTF